MVRSGWSVAVACWSAVAGVLALPVPPVAAGGVDNPIAPRVAYSGVRTQRWGCSAGERAERCGATAARCAVEADGSIVIRCAADEASSSASTAGSPTPEPKPRPSAATRFFTRTVHRFLWYIAAVRNWLASRWVLLPGVLLLACAVFFLCLAGAVDRVAAMLLGCISGLSTVLFGYACGDLTFGYHWYSDLWKALPLAVAPLLTGVLSGLFMRACGGPSGGAVVGAIAGALGSWEALLRGRGDVGAAQFFAPLVAAAVGSVLGRAGPRLFLMLGCSMVGALTLAAGLMEVLPAAALGGHCRNLGEWSRCRPSYAPEMIMACAAALGALSWVLWRRYLRRRAAAEVLHADDLEYAQLLALQDERRPRLPLRGRDSAIL